VSQDCTTAACHFACLVPTALSHNPWQTLQILITTHVPHFWLNCTIDCGFLWPPSSNAHGHSDVGHPKGTERPVSQHFWLKCTTIWVPLTSVPAMPLATPMFGQHEGYEGQLYHNISG